MNSEGFESIKQEYEGNKTVYDRLRKEIEFILKERLESQRIPYHLVEGRVKGWESIAKKLRERDNWSTLGDLSDVCGLRVVCLFSSDVDRICKLIESTFRITKTDDKRSTKPEDSFGYLSVHYDAVLPESYKGERYDSLKGMKFEIQVRTIATHAWCSISHHLDYKHPSTVPSSLRRDFNALSALFHLADSTFERFYEASIEEKRAVEGKPLEEIEKEEINFHTVYAYVTFKYPERGPTPPEHVHVVTLKLQRYGCRIVSELDGYMRRTEKAFEELEKDFKKAGYTDIHGGGVI